MVIAVGCHQAAQLQQLSPQLENCHQKWVAPFMANGLQLKQRKELCLWQRRGINSLACCQLGLKGDQKEDVKSLPSVLVFLKG